MRYSRTSSASGSKSMSWNHAALSVTCKTYQHVTTLFIPCDVSLRTRLVTVSVAIGSFNANVVTESKAIKSKDNNRATKYLRLQPLHSDLCDFQLETLSDRL